MRSEDAGSGLVVNLILFIFASVVVIAAVVLTLLRRAQQARTLKSASHEASTFKPRIAATSLFPEQQLSQSVKTDECASLEQRRRVCLELSTRGDREALIEANADENLYAEVLNSLLDQTQNDCEALKSLAAYIIEQKNLPGSERLAASIQNCWQQAPDARSSALALRVAALSGRPERFQAMAETICAALIEGRFEGLSAGELKQSIQSEYWLLNDKARRGGAGFELKQELKVMLEALARNEREKR